jgi:hypothetical protein
LPPFFGGGAQQQLHQQFAPSPTHQAQQAATAAAAFLNLFQRQQMQSATPSPYTPSSLAQQQADGSVDPNMFFNVSVFFVKD